MNNLNVNFKAEVEGKSRSLPVPTVDLISLSFAGISVIVFDWQSFFLALQLDNHFIYTDCTTLCNVYFCDDVKKICFDFQKVEDMCDSSVDLNTLSCYVVERTHEGENCKRCNLV